VVEIPGQPGLVGGLFARATVRVGEIAGALVVPPAALVREGADPTAATAFVVRQGKAEKVDVALGVEAPDGIQVTKGLTAGDVVVLDPPTTLASGAPVDVQNGGRPAATASVR
jgi:multidrug efflux pump subunit AcrA (membrane-fusion protein)